MNKIYITGNGVLCRAGKNMKEIMNRLVNQEDLLDEQPLSIPMLYNTREIRGVDRYSLLALITTKLALQERELGEEYDPYRVGTLLTTEYGPMSTNLKFLNTLYASSVEFVSPKLFSATVANICLGHVCIKFNFKGASTMFINTSNIPYSYNLLKNNMVDIMVTGGLDEYQKDLFDDIKHYKEYMDNNSPSEGCGILILERSDSPYLREDKIIAELVASSNRISNKQAYAYNQIPVDKECMIDAMENAIEKAEISKSDVDLIVMGTNGSDHLNKVESEAIEYVFRGDHIMTTAPNVLLNNIYSLANNVNIAFAATCLDEDVYPIIDYKTKQVTSYHGSYFHILVNTLTIDGNVSSVILRKYNK